MIRQGRDIPVATVDQDFVFRDFGASKLMSLRALVAERPYWFLMVYLTVVLYWIVSMSYGAILHGSNRFSINHMPHIAFFILSLGVMIYPLRYIWIPLGSYILLFYVPLLLPFLADRSWFPLTYLAPNILIFFLAMNVVAGAVIGALGSFAFDVAQKRMAPFQADLFTIIFVILTFILVNLIVLGIVRNYCAQLPQPLAQEIGFDKDFTILAVNRIFRGGAVIGAFLLAALQTPQMRHMHWIGLTLVAYLVIAQLHTRGIQGYPMLDVVAFSLFLSVVLPLRITALAIALGVASYAAITGGFLKDIPPPSDIEFLLETYSILGLFIMLVVIAVRSFQTHLWQQQNDSIRRLNTVRDFAGVGIFAINLNHRRVRLDPACQRILALGAQTPMRDLLALLDVGDRWTLARSLLGPREKSSTMLLTLNPQFADTRNVRVFLWFERTPTGEEVAYGLLVDVTMEHKQEVALTSALETLSEKEERQRQMFSIISHEIRTPASVISMLVDDLSTSVAPKPIAGQMREAADQLLGALADMRQAVNPEKNLPVHLAPYVPSDLAETVRNTYQLMASEQQVALRLSLGTGSNDERLGDTVRIKQILGNLIRNAVIHGGGDQILITHQILREDDVDWCSWTVEDNGVGIAQAELERMFQPFERGSQDPRNRKDGSGLGLFIVKQSVEVLGGTITYFPAKDGGSGFEVRLPALDAPKAQQPQDIPKRSPETFAKMRVILAEDNALVAQVTAARLRKIFGEVIIAENGQLALDAIEKQTPDILITDLFMPEMEGDTLSQTLRAQGYDFPIIGLTAAAVGDDKMRFESAGASLVMFKPLDQDEMLEFLAKTM